MTLTFTIPGQPKPKTRHSTVVTLRCGKCQRTCIGQRSECPKCGAKNLYFLYSHEYSDKDQREYEKFAAGCALQGMNGNERLIGPLAVDCVFYFAIPKTGANSKKQEGDWHTQRPDVDNLKKTVMDACNELVWADDCIVSRISGEKRWTLGCPRTVVSVTSLSTSDTTAEPELGEVKA